MGHSLVVAYKYTLQPWLLLVTEMTRESDTVEDNGGLSLQQGFAHCRQLTSRQILTLFSRTLYLFLLFLLLLLLPLLLFSMPPYLVKRHVLQICLVRAI